jgi:TPR repeat protein
LVAKGSQSGRRHFAAQHGHSFFKKGKGVIKDLELSQRYLTFAAAQGVAKAEAILSRMASLRSPTRSPPLLQLLSSTFCAYCEAVTADLKACALAAELCPTAATSAKRFTGR